MGYRIFDDDTTLAEAEESCLYTVEALDAHPIPDVRQLARPLATHLEVLPTVEAAVRKARRAVVRGSALVRVGDGVADDEVRELAKDVLGHVRQDRKAPLYRAFFEDAPNEIVRLSLAPEVNELERFQRVLATTPEAAPLRACWEPRIAAVIERAKSALAQRGAAAVEDAQSDELARRWIEIADRLRRSISGALRTYAAENGLPRDFEDRFFPPPPRKRRRRAGGGED